MRTLMLALVAAGAFASLAAIKLGKHVYCEKPLTHSVWEARQIAKAARGSPSLG